MIWLENANSFLGQFSLPLQFIIIGIIAWTLMFLTLRGATARIRDGRLNIPVIAKGIMVTMYVLALLYIRGL